MNINCLTNHNCNVLTLAATQCRINAVKYLLKEGVHVFHKTSNGCDILNILDEPKTNDNTIHPNHEIGIINGLYATSNGEGGIIPIQVFNNFSSSIFLKFN